MLVKRKVKGYVNIPNGKVDITDPAMKKELGVKKQMCQFAQEIIVVLTMSALSLNSPMLLRQ